jgi:hypothetical protein
MVFTIPSIRGYWRAIVTQTGYLGADEIKATSGYMFTFGGSAVSWKSCKQTILTRSIMEAELTTLVTATVEA